MCFVISHEKLLIRKPWTKGVFFYLSKIKSLKKIVDFTRSCYRFTSEIHIQSQELSTHVRLISQCKYFHKSNGSLSSIIKVSMYILQPNIFSMCVLVNISRINIWIDEYTKLCTNGNRFWIVCYSVLCSTYHISHYRLPQILFTNPWLYMFLISIIRG